MIVPDNQKSWQV